MKTVGSILERARKERKLDFEKIWEETKIHPRFLQALEAGDYSAFSSPIHIKGFLRTYVRFLDLDEEEVMAFFRREFNEARMQRRVEEVRPLRGLRVFWTPGWIVGFLGVVLALAFLGYLFWGYRRYAGAPLLIVDQPSSDLTVEETTIEVVGHASRGAEVTLNGERLTVAEDGNFVETVSLSYGANTLEFVATNPWGRKSVVTRTVVVKTPSGEQ
jgi:cytoskeletal protein RodZ